MDLVRCCGSELVASHLRRGRYFTFATMSDTFDTYRGTLGRSWSTNGKCF
jgi:hypothetical protein